MQLKMESAELEFQELVNKKQKEIKIEVDKKVSRIKLVYLIIELALSITGYTIIGYNFGGWAVFGIFLIQWGNNMSLVRDIYKGKSILKVIWEYNTK